MSKSPTRYEKTGSQEGNRTLREMSTMRARSLCKAELRADPKAEARYKEWTEGFEDGLRSETLAED